jgi:K+-transporting ATPase ATPase C chain
MIAIRTLLTLTLLLGVAYPRPSPGWPSCLPWQANGSLLTNAKQQVVGSALLAQKFERADYFHSRPSASDFATIGGGASNLGMSSPLRAEFAAAAARAQPEARVPALLTRSASGLDPHLPLDAALAQVDGSPGNGAGSRSIDGAGQVGGTSWYPWPAGGQHSPVEPATRSSKAPEGAPCRSGRLPFDNGDKHEQ